MPGNGAIIINNKPFEEMIDVELLRHYISEPLRITDNLGKLNAIVKVAGGGFSSQASAICHGISRALVAADESLRPLLRKHGLLTRDSRVKERKKYGLRRARKARQYRKR